MNLTTEYCSAFNPDASETVAYNNPLFPAYARYGILSTYPDYSAVSHWHEDLEFIVIDKGHMTYNINGELIELKEKDGIMVNSRQLHYGFSAERHECEFICILLSPKLLHGNEWFYQNYVERITRNSACPYLYLDHQGWQSGIIEKLRELYRRFHGSTHETLSYFAVYEQFSAILSLLFRHMPAEGSMGPGDSYDLAALKSMIAYIEEHLSERIALADIAAAGACCKSRCALLFKKYLRDTPITYTTKIRLNKSLTALLTTEKSITDIAGEYGFFSASYYCETFRKYYQVSPSLYRNLQAGG